MVRRPTFQVLVASYKALEDDSTLLSSLGWSAAVLTGGTWEMDPKSSFRKSLDQCNIGFKVLLQKNKLGWEDLARVLHILV